MGRAAIWILLCLVALGAIGLFVVDVRHGRARARLKSASKETAADAAWRASLPSVDPEYRQRAWAWLTTDWPTGNTSFSEKEERWFLDGEAPPAELVTRHEAEREHMTTLDALLDRPDPCISSAAFLGWPREGREHDFGVSRVPNFVACSNAAHWYGLETMLVADPIPVLDRLDRLHAALRPACSLIDGMIHVSLAGVRDRAYLRLIFHDALPGPRVDAWLSERCAAPELYAESFRSDRLLLWVPIGQALARDDPRAQAALYGDDMDLEDTLDFVWYARRDVTKMIRASRLVEDHLLGRAEADTLEKINRWAENGGRTAAWSLPNHGAIFWTVVAVDAEHRMYRLLARVRRAVTEAPADQVALRALLGSAASELEAGPWSVAIAYERIAAHRVRFFVPLDSPLPAATESRREQELGGWQERSPFAKRARIFVTQFAAEVDLAR